MLAADAHDLSIDAVVALLDLALTELSMGRARRAARRLASLDERIPPAQPSRYRPWIELLRLAVLAGEGRWDAADQHLEELDSLQLPSGDRDALFLVELAAVAAGQGGELALAHDVCELASDLTSPDEAEALQRRIAALAESSRERSSQ